MIPVRVGAGKNINSAMGNKIIVKKSNIEGNGIFATAHIKRGELICVFSGKRLSIAQLRKKYQKGEERVSDPLQINDRQYLDLDEPYIFFNHSCQPNATVVDKQRLIAVRNIEAGEEITFDYSVTEWTDASFKEWTDPEQKNYQKWLMNCYCGASACRQQVGDFLSLPQKLQKDYVEKKLVQGFIIKKYKKYQRRVD